MRVAVNAVGLAPGGGLSLLLNQVRRFEVLSRSWDFTYFVSPRCAAALRETVRRGTVVVPFSRQPGYVARFAWEQLELPRRLQRDRYDVLYCVGNYAVFRAPIPQLVIDHNSSHFAGAKELGGGAAWAIARLKREVARASVRRAEAVIYLSDAFATGMRSVGFPPPTRVIPSGVNIDLPGSCSVELPVACEVCRGGGYALAVHDWYPHKRVGWLASAWASSPDLCTRHLVVVGAALTKGARRERDSAKRSAEAGGYVHFLDGAGRNEVAVLYREAGMYVSASVLEAFPLTPFEAMSFSVPCVLSDIPPHREVAGPAATYYKVGDVDSLRSAVRQAKAERATLIKHGMERIREFSWERHTRALLEEFRTLAR